MNAELLDRLAESTADLIGWIEKSTNSGASFVQEQAPLVAQELLAWTFWQAVIYMGISLVVIIVTFLSAKYACKLIAECKCGNDEDRLLGKIAVTIMSILVMVMGFCIGCVYFLATMHVLIAPRVVILEKVKDLLP